MNTMDFLTIPLIHNWRSTLVGLAQCINGMVAAVQVFGDEHSGFVHPETLVWFLFINALLQALKGWVSKDALAGSARPQEVVDAKLDNIPPRD